MVDHLLAVGDHAEAGRLAVVAALPEAMRATVRAALRAQPPRVAPPVLRQWRNAEVMPPGDPHARWLAVACAANAAGNRREVIEQYEFVRQAFEEIGDVEAEISVGLAMATQARRADDLATLFRLVARAEALVAAGTHEALAPAVLGRALGHQFAGDAEGALRALDEFPSDRLEGDWSAQVAMIRGANLMLLGKAEAAIDALAIAASHGSEWTYAVALELLGAARWHLGDAVGAIEDLRWSQLVGQRISASGVVHLAEAHLAAMEAADGRDWSSSGATSGGVAPGDDEVRRLLAVAEVLRAAGRGDTERAAALAADLPFPDRAVRSAAWIVALRTALVGEDERLQALARGAPAIAAALSAGRDGARHLAGGPAAPDDARASLPAAWCAPRPSTVEIRLLGAAEVRSDGQLVDHPDWERTRVRELCLHLALVTGCSREQVAADLWPDLDPEAAGRNLRVTLTYLANVLEPDRTPRTTGELIDSRAGLLAFVDSPRLRIDLREATAATEAVGDGAAVGDDATLVRSARMLLRHPRMDLLGGALAAPWVEIHDRERRDATLRAARRGAPRLIDLGHDDLAEDLARRGLAEDPWAERLHQVMVRACLARDDLDAARRALRTGLVALQDLGVRPEPTTVELAELLGLPLVIQAEAR
jgi:DNA-binding SARP family transcriptional activator